VEVKAFLFSARLLSSFEDEDEDEDEDEFTSALVSQPKPFRCFAEPK
jgi:hypothetical protein